MKIRWISNVVLFVTLLALVGVVYGVDEQNVNQRLLSFLAMVYGMMQSQPIEAGVYYKYS